MKSEERREGNVPVYGSNGQIGWHGEALVNGPGIVVGRKGNTGTVTWVPYDFFPIDTTFYVISRKAQLPLSYLFHVLESLDLPSLAADSAVPGLNRNMAYLSEILAPGVAVTRMFDERTRPLREQIALNNEESRTLAALRDTLLPKLLSGEVRVKQAKKIVGEAV